MKQRFLLRNVLPIFASIAIIGSGYAIWHFNDTESNESTNTSLSITNVIRGAYLQSNFDSLKITFDQTADGRGQATSDDSSNSSLSVSSTNYETAKGIYLTATKTEITTSSDGNTSSTTSTISDPTITYKNDEEISGVNYADPSVDKDDEDALVGQEFKVVLTLPTSLASYLNIETNTNDENWPSVVIDTPLDENGDSLNITTYTWTNTSYGEVNWKWSYAKFSYTATSEPKDMDAYNRLKSVIEEANKSSNCSILYQGYRWAK